MLRDKHNKKNPTQPNPVFPNWVYDRPALLGDFITSPTPPGDPAVAIGELISYSSLLRAVILSSASWVTWWHISCWCINCVLHHDSVCCSTCAQVRCPWLLRNKLWSKICCLSWSELMGVTSQLSLSWGGRTAPSSLIQHWTCLSKSWWIEYCQWRRITPL